MEERPRRTGLDRISTEAQEEEQMGDILERVMEHQAVPGMMSTGKQVQATQQSAGSFFIQFNDGSGLQFIGDFSVSYVERLELPGEERTDINGS